MNRLPRLYLPLLLLIIAAFAYRPWEGGDDFWAHAAIGRWALEHHQVPHHTLFLWGAYKAEHVFHAWLSGVVFALPLLAGGPHAGPWLALGLNIVLAMFPFALLWIWAQRRTELSGFVALLMIPAIWTASVRWHLRPEVFTVAFLAILFLFFSSETRPLWKCALVVFMFGLWPNFHGGVLIGLMVLWASTLAESAQFRTKVPQRIGFALACTAAVFIGSPYHLGYIDTWKDFQSPMFKGIDEWKSFWVPPALNPQVVVGIAFLWFIALYTWLIAPQRQRRWSQLLWLLLMGASFLQARRQLWLCSTTAIAIILINASVWRTEVIYERWRNFRRGAGLEPTPPDALRRLARYGVLGILVLSFAVALPSDGMGQALAKRFPTGMARYLLEHPASGRVINDYTYSAALEWLLDDKRPIYVDLINAYPPQLYFDYLEVARATPTGLKILQTTGATVVALRSPDEDEKPIALGEYLDKQPDWKRVYEGKDGTVWQKR